MAAKKKKSHRRRTAAAAKPAPRHKKRRRVTREAPKARRRVAGGQMMEASKRKRPKKRRARRVAEAWKGDTAGHSRAAKKGHRRRKAKRRAAPRRRARETGFAYEAKHTRRRSKKRRHVRAVSEAPKRRRSSKKRRHMRSPVRRMFASRGGSSSGMSAAQFGVAIVASGLGYVLSDAVDRFLATYNPDPASTAAKPTDKFTSDGAGTLANTLNIAAHPNMYRLGASVGLAALPAVASLYVKNPMLRSSLEGLAIGSGVKLFSLLWNNLVMGNLLAPKDTSVAGLQKSKIARLYPAEVAATINTKQTPAQLSGAAAVSNGSLSDAPQLQQATAGVGAPGDVGPFALQGSSEYPDVAQALRQSAGVHEQFPSLQNVWGTGDRYPSAQEALRHAAQMNLQHRPAGLRDAGPPAYEPGPPPGPGPGPQTGKDDSCGCSGVGENNAFLGFVGDAQEETTTLY